MTGKSEVGVVESTPEEGRGLIRGDPGLRRISASKFTTWTRCPLQYRLRYIDHVEPEPTGPKVLGVTLHKVFEAGESTQAWRHGDDALPTLSMLFRELLVKQVAEDSDNGKKELRWGKKSHGWKDGSRGPYYPEENLAWMLEQGGPEIISAWIDTRIEDEEKGWKVLRIENDLAIEVHVIRELPGLDAELNGYIDLLIVNPEGELVIRDYKSGQKDTGPGPLMAGQLYKRLVKLGLDLTAVKFELVYLRTRDAAKRRVTYSLEPGVEAFEDGLTGYLMALVLDHFPATPGQPCQSCDVRHACPLWLAFEKSGVGE